MISLHLAIFNATQCYMQLSTITIIRQSRWYTAVVAPNSNLSTRLVTFTTRGPLICISCVFTKSGDESTAADTLIVLFASWRPSPQRAQSARFATCRPLSLRFKNAPLRKENKRRGHTEGGWERTMFVGIWDSRCWLEGRGGLTKAIPQR